MAVERYVPKSHTAAKSTTWRGTALILPISQTDADRITHIPIATVRDECMCVHRAGRQEIADMSSPPRDANRLRDIFSKAIEHHPAGQWQTFLDSARDGNEPLADRSSACSMPTGGSVTSWRSRRPVRPTILTDAVTAAPGTGVRPRLASSA